MSVIRPRPPTDPIEHLLPAGAGPDDAGWRRWIEDGGEVRRDLLAATTDRAEAMLERYGTAGARVPRRESELFAILDAARTVREKVDRVVVVGDAIDRAAVDLLLATCCHPYHDGLPRSARGGRPAIATLGPGDDDDVVQGLLDLLAAPRGDRLAEAWGLVIAGPCASPPGRAMAAFLRAASWSSGDGPPPATTTVVAPARGTVVVDLPSGDPAEPGAQPGIEVPPAERILSAAALVPASIAGIDVVRFLEGAAAMQRRFRESRPEENPVLTAAAVGRWLARSSGATCPPRRRLAPRGGRWNGLDAWSEALLAPLEPAAPVETRFQTDVIVARSRRRPFPAADAPPSGEPRRFGDAIHLPRCDEHTIGQLVSLLGLAAAVESRLG